MQEEQTGSGRLKIFFSYAPGTGKTQAMLAAARKEKERGADVVTGCLKEIPEMCGLSADPSAAGAKPEYCGLEWLPPRQIRYQGKDCQEFDPDRALERKPQILLLDDMAHINREGSRHARRY